MRHAGKEFPVNLDEVWPLVYNRKDNAVRVLTENFIEGIDYQFVRKEAENPLGGRPAIEYRISVSCLEYLIVDTGVLRQALLQNTIYTTQMI